MGPYMTLPFVVARIFNQKKILLGQQENLKRKPYPLFWDLPGGKVLPDETFDAALIREITEETGLTVTKIKLFGVFHHFPKTFARGFTKTEPGTAICFDIKYKGNLAPTEMKNMGWIDINEARKLKLTPWAKYFLKDMFN